MITRQEEYKNDEAYAKVCLEQIDILHNVNRSINKMPIMSERQMRIIQDNRALIMQLRREYTNAI